MEPYIPHLLPLQGIDANRLLSWVGEAGIMVGRYDGLLQGIVNPAVMLSPLMNEEAVLSSRIEGTQATIDEVLEQEAGMIKEGEKFHDIQEILNYRRALFSAQNALENGAPITLYLLRELHKILLDSVRGADKNPGEFRKDQNWIGSYGCKVDNATFVPPNPMQLDAYLENWGNYAVGKDIDVLIQAGVLHAQFELLHPFKDGNGRIGRILIPLFLFQKKALSKPMFYLSSYLESHRDEYYHRLHSISMHDDWNGWLEFFLKAIVEQARDNSVKVKKIMTLYEDMKQRIQSTTRSQYMIQILDALFAQPIFKSADFTTRTGIARLTAAGYIRQLREAGILKELAPRSGSRGSVFCFPELLNVIEGKRTF
ncbi:MAG: Fic family protein [Synergistaceae bacterium]|nr:Fic family protein [Synergistaceae bacterium]